MIHNFYIVDDTVVVLSKHAIWGLTSQWFSTEATFAILTGDITPLTVLKKKHFRDLIMWHFRKFSSV